MSETIWESITRLDRARKKLLCSLLHPDFIQKIAEKYCAGINTTFYALDDGIEFFHGSIICLARLDRKTRQIAAYAGHRKYHALKFQITITPDVLRSHAVGPIEGLRND